MAGNRPGDWHVLDLDKDPTPGDPDRVRHLSKNLHDFADDVSDALRLIKGMADEDAVLKWAGKSAKAFQDEFSGVPKQLKKLKKSYEMAGDALAAYWPKLERAQALADKALAKGREAQSDLSSAKSRLSSADSWVTKANKEADKYKDDPTGSKDKEKPDEAKVRAATRDAQHAKSAQTSAQSDVTSANSALDAAKKMAEDARKMREEAAGEAKRKIDEASDAGIHNRKWWEEVGDWFSDNWDTIVTVCKVVVAVVGIIAMIIGGPILGAIVLVAALVVLADTLNKYAKGQASLWDVAFAALDCIPGGKGLTSVGKLAKGLKGLGKTGLKGMALGMKGLGKSTRSLSRQMKNLFTCGDPIDMATGQMVMSETDVTLPGVLPLVLERHHRTGQRSGRFFGPSWSSTLDQRLLLDATGVRFVNDDGMVLYYPVPEPDVPVFPVEGPRWPMEWDGTHSGRITVRRPETGQTLRFASLPGPASAELLIAGISDRNGNSIAITYSGEGTPTEVVHHGGYRIGVTCGSGRITELRLVSDPDEPTLMRYAYDSRGNLTEVYNSSGLPQKFIYDDRRRITGWDDRNGTWYRYTYDDVDKCAASQGIDGILDYTYVYDDEACTATATNSLGHTSHYQFNDSYQLVVETDALGNATHRTWDRYDSLLSLTDPLGRLTGFDYDAAGRLTRIRLPDGSVTTTEFGELGLPVMVVEPNGARWRQSYDTHGNLVEAVDPTGAVTRYTYAPGGRLATHTDPLGHTRTLTTDAAGLPLELTDSLGGTTRCTRDAFGRVVELRDPAGQVTRMGWTVEGLLAFSEAPDGSRESWEYDAEGNEIAHQELSGGTTFHEIGPFDLPRVRINPDGTVYKFDYDSEQQLRRVTNPQGRAWTYDFDAAGRLVAERDFNGSDLSYHYDSAGQLTRRANESGEALDYSYDLLGNTVEHRFSDGSISTFGHDATGQLVWARNADAEVELRRDAMGRIVHESINGRTVTSGYDPLGRRTERVTPSGVVSQWTYDSEDRPTSLKAQGHTLGFEYDATGHEVRRRLGRRAILSQSWQQAGLLGGQEILTEGPTGVSTLWRRRFSYASGGQVSAIDELGAGTRQFQFDALGRVTSVVGSQWMERYTYDAAGNVSSAAAPGPDGHFADERETSGTLVRRAGNSTYEHDTQGRVIRRIKRTLSGIRKVWTYAWSSENRLTDVFTPDGAHWHYRYDPLGRRISKEREDGVGTTGEYSLFDWDGENLTEEVMRSGEVRTWEYEPGTHRPILQVDRTPEQDDYDQRFYAIVTNMVGTPTELISEEGEISWQSRTTLWGSDAGTTASGTDCPLRFPGQYYDAESGWHYNFYRYYDPQTAQYTSPDPLGLLPEDNHHGYVRNPLSWLDALGLAPCAKVIALRLWKARNNQGGYSVYHGLDAQGNKIYAGITNKLARRERQHIAKNYGIVRLQEVRGATGLKKWQARAIEQGLIEDVRASGFSRIKNGVSIPQINSISPKRSIYGTALRYGRIFLA
ncbi:DUF6531 domain-containing protein [Streptomyces sp. NPDC050564]|uniref:DUF6531 domain-containing protein n=1 Tax=Streptomyces sp. NPDC050564 TaxID=3365631 RepID=UPI0037B49695